LIEVLYIWDKTNRCVPAGSVWTLQSHPAGYNCLATDFMTKQTPEQDQILRDERAVIQLFCCFVKARTFSPRLSQFRALHRPDMLTWQSWRTFFRQVVGFKSLALENNNSALNQEDTATSDTYLPPYNPVLRFGVASLVFIVLALVQVSVNLGGMVCHVACPATSAMRDVWGERRAERSTESKN